MYYQYTPTYTHAHIVKDIIYIIYIIQTYIYMYMYVCLYIHVYMDYNFFPYREFSNLFLHISRQQSRRLMAAQLPSPPLQLSCELPESVGHAPHPVQGLLQFGDTAVQTGLSWKKSGRGLGAG